MCSCTMVDGWNMIIAGWSLVARANGGLSEHVTKLWDGRAHRSTLIKAQFSALDIAAKRGTSDETEATQLRTHDQRIPMDCDSMWVDYEIDMGWIITDTTGFSTSTCQEWCTPLVHGDQLLYGWWDWRSWWHRTMVMAPWEIWQHPPKYCR